MVLYSAKAKVKGKVQEVSFRNFAKKNADILGLRGYVKNLGDGSVEVFLEGDKDVIETMMEALRVGSDKAVVRTVDIEWHPHTNMFTDFKIIY